MLFITIYFVFKDTVVNQALRSLHGTHLKFHLQRNMSRILSCGIDTFKCEYEVFVEFFKIFFINLINYLYIRSGH